MINHAGNFFKLLIPYSHIKLNNALSKLSSNIQPWKNLTESNFAASARSEVYDLKSVEKVAS